MGFSTVTDTALTNTTLIARSERIDNASIFPFFGKSGQVKQLMVLLPDAGTVCMLPFEKGLATVSFLSVVRLSMDLAQIKSHADFAVRQVDQLYHYDPAWHLSHERFEGYWAKKLIKQSNCVEHLDNKVRNLLFSNDLSTLEQFLMKSGLLNTFKTITPEMLLEPLPPTPSQTGDLSAPADGGWQLNPIWKDQEWESGHWR